MSVINDKFLGTTCERCNYGKMYETDSEWWVSCSDCNALLFCYEPLPHQIKFHADPHKYRMFAGGYGSGKSTTTVAEIIRHVLETPNGTTLMGAATLPQLENTSMKIFFEMIPSRLIKNRSIQKNNVDMINGHRVIFRPLDSEGKARSLNLTAFHIEEASEVGYDYFVQLQTRLRNHATTKHMGLVSTNPDSSWVKHEFLLKSDVIHNAETKYHQDQDEINTNFSTHVAPTSLNTFLPPNFYEDTARGKPDFWIARYLDGSFEYAEGTVFPQFPKNIVEDFPIPKHWERLAGVDFGLRDPTVMLNAAIDPKTGITYIYKEHYESNKPVPYHAEKMNEMLSDIPSGRLRPIVADPSGKKSNINDSRSLFDHYGEYGLYFKAGNNRIDAGIHKVYAYLELGKLKIFRSLKHTINEGINYKYKQQDLASDKNADEKPVDKDNHAMDTLRYIVQELPDDPNQLVNHSVSALDIYNVKKQENIPYALQDDDDSYNSGMDWSQFY